eukprot:jgi/Chlat1/4643/Chrsp3S05601
MAAAAAAATVCCGTSSSSWAGLRHGVLVCARSEVDKTVLNWHHRERPGRRRSAFRPQQAICRNRVGRGVFAQQLQPHAREPQRRVDDTNYYDREVHDWSARQSAELYRVDGWGAPYFGINSKGNLTVKPCGEYNEELDVMQVMDAARRLQLHTPLILRFPQILQHRMHQLQHAFQTAIEMYGYKGRYEGVFPVKSNHDRHLLDNIVQYGNSGSFAFGLEAGSKPEVLIGMATLRRHGSKALLVCNGYKDEEYIETVLLSRQLGVNAVIVLEQAEELPIVLKVSKRLNVAPVLGVRAKLGIRHSGYWGSTSGDTAKFGLRAAEIVDVLEQLRQVDMLDCLRLLHFHIGSQIPSISIIKDAMREASYMYCELAGMGAAMGYLDVGGGLGVDYDGSKLERSSSTNYSIQNYANDIVAAIQDACAIRGVAPPVVTSESGRALASHQSILVFDILAAASPATAASTARVLAAVQDPSTANLPAWKQEVAAAGKQQQSPGHVLLATFRHVLTTTSTSNFQEAYNDAVQFKKEAESLFRLGCLSLLDRAEAESLFWATAVRVLDAARMVGGVPDYLQGLEKALASVYYANLSIFRSAPDSWAIQQLFPIMPIHRLTEKPVVMATLADLTCDSDGKIDQFIGRDRSNSEIEELLPVHPLVQGQTYLLGLFMGGVYQETMGSLHNMFGSTNAVHVQLVQTPEPDQPAFEFTHVVQGQAMGEVMKTANHDGDDMLALLAADAAEAVRTGCLEPSQSQLLLQNYERCLRSYTYLRRY